LLKYFFPPTERPPKKKLMASVHKQTIPTRWPHLISWAQDRF
jgi:hypothetical protein